MTTCTKHTIIEKISTKNNQTPSQAKDTVETQAPENVEIYEHLGFKKVHVKEIPKICITNWSMLREPEKQ